MSITVALKQADIQYHLKALPAWRYENNKLVRTCDCPTYADALALTNQIGQLAERLDHHPDMWIQYKMITIYYWTHTVDGVTLKDIEAAQWVEQLIDSV